MKRILFSTLVTLFAVPAFAQLIDPPAVGLLLKETCGSIVTLLENRMAQAKSELADVQEAKSKMKADFIYPQAVLASLNFKAGAPKLYELMSPETVALAAKYNMVYQQIDEASNIPVAMRPEMKRQLQRTYGEQLAGLIIRDLSSTLNGVSAMKNGNRIEDSTMSWGVYYAPTGDIPALSIHQLARVKSYEPRGQTGKQIDPRTAVTVTFEMHYNPVSKTFSHLAKFATAEDVEPMFVRSEKQFQSGYFFFTDNIEQTAKSQIELAEKDASYRECKKLNS